MILFLFGLWLLTSYSEIFIQNLRYKTNVLVGKAQSFPSRNLQSSKRTAGSSSQVPKKAYVKFSRSAEEGESHLFKRCKEAFIKVLAFS